MWRKIFPIIITVALVWFLLSKIELQKGIDMLKNLPIHWVVLGFAAYVATTLFRSLRWQILIYSKDVSFRNIFAVTSLHAACCNILPARSGELSYPYLLKKTQDVPFTESAATLLIARIFDFAAILILFLISAVVSWKMLPEGMLKATLAGAVLLLLCGISLFYFASIARFLTNLLKKARTNAKFSEKLDMMTGSLEVIRSNRTYPAVLATSLLNWGFKYLMFLALLTAMGIKLDMWKVIFCATLSQLTTVLPIQGIGGFGTLETGWVVAFVLMGVDRKLAVTSGFISHIVTIMYSLIMAGLGAVILRRLACLPGSGARK